MKQALDSSDVEHEWKRMVAILSLDRALPFFTHIALAPNDISAFQHLLRRWLHGSLSGSSNATSKSLISELREQLGDASATEFERWVEGVYFARDDPSILTWQFLLVGCCRNGERWRTLVPQASEELRHVCMKIIADDRAQSVAQAAYDLPLSNWDLGIYALFNFDEDENDPITRLELIVEQVMFMKIWRLMEGSIPADDRDAFLGRAQVMASQMKSRVELRWPETEYWPI